MSMTSTKKYQNLSFFHERYIPDMKNTNAQTRYIAAHALALPPRIRSLKNTARAPCKHV